MTALKEPEMHRRLRKALKQGGDFYTLEDILQEIHDGKMQSFTDGTTWVITSILDYPRVRVLELFMVVGTIAGARILSPEIEAFAKKVGATRIVAEGRKGWQSVNESFGWKVGNVKYYKDVA